MYLCALDTKITQPLPVFDLKAKEVSFASLLAGLTLRCVSKVNCDAYCCLTGDVDQQVTNAHAFRVSTSAVYVYRIGGRLF